MVNADGAPSLVTHKELEIISGVPTL